MDYQPGSPQNGPGNGYNPYNNNPYNNNPYNNNPHTPYGAPMQQMPVRHKGSDMAAASMVLGIISLVSLLFLKIAIPFFLGGISIILALLSRGSLKKLFGRAKVGLICSATALGLDILICVLSIWVAFILPDQSPAFRAELNRAFEQQYNITYDELMEELDNVWQGGDMNEDIWEKIGY